MKLYTITFMSLGFFLLQSVALFSMQDEQLFLQGNQFFAHQHYAQACDAYKMIENKGFIVLYNLSLSYLNQGNQSQAIIYGRRAEQQANFQELTQLYDLFDCMNRQIDPDYVPGWYEQLAIFLKKCILSISMLLLQICLLITLILLMLCWYRRWHQVNMNGFLSLLFVCILLMVMWWNKTNMMQRQVGIVTKNLISVFAGPDESFYKKSELHEVDEVTIISKQQGYYQVRAKQVIGWIHDKDIELV